MKKALLSTVVSAILLGTMAICLAQDSTPNKKTLLTISVNSYDTVFEKIGFFGKLAGNPDMAKGLDGMLMMMTQGKGLVGLDKSKQWGVVVETDGQAFQAYGVLPVGDLQGLLGALVPIVGPAKDVGKGVFEIQAQAKSIYAKQFGEWAVLSDSPEALETLSLDPKSMLGGVNKKFDISVRANIQNIPKELRQMFVAQLQMGAQLGAQQMPTETDEQFALKTKATADSFKQLNKFLDEADVIEIGLAIDSASTGAISLDVEMTAIPGTEIAKKFAAAADSKTNFAGFYVPDAAIAFIQVGQYSENDVAQLKTTMQHMKVQAAAEIDKQKLPEEKAKLAKDLVGKGLGLIEETVAAGKCDLGMSVLIDDGGVTAMGGGFLADGDKLNKLIKELADVATKESPEAASSITLNDETFEGVTLHKISIPVPKDCKNYDKAVALIGKNLDIVIGVGTNDMYVATGKNAITKLKQAIKASKASPDKKIIPARFSLSATPIAELAAKLVDGETAKKNALKVGKILRESGGKDHISVIAKAIPNGISTQLKIEEGLLKVLVYMIKQQQQQSGVIMPAVTEPSFDGPQ